MIVIIDYGVGNLGSVQNMLKKIGVPSIISSDIDTIRQAEKVILPGVGAYAHAMEKIHDKGLRQTLDFVASERKIPVLGICLGMQLLLDFSEEGCCEGLGWIPGRVSRFPRELDVKVPHMGWNLVTSPTFDPLSLGLEKDSRFYFVHSYYALVEKKEDSVFKCFYGGIEFDAGIHHNNVFGVQFHPEKSHKFGMRLLSNFARIQ